MKKGILWLRIFFIVVCFVVMFTNCRRRSGTAAGSSAEGGTVANMNLSGYPIAIEPVTLRVAVTKRPQHNRSVREFEYLVDLEKKTNVKIDWVEYEAGQADEKRKLAFATNQLPDVFLDPVYQANTYGSEGQLIPLNSLIRNYAPDMWGALQTYPDAIRVMTNPTDGNWYAMTLIRDPMYGILSDPDLFINRKWLDNLGLKVPETITEFFEALKAFRDNDIIPFAFCFQEGGPNYSFVGMYIMFHPFGVAENPQHMQVVNGRLRYTFTMPQFRDGVRFLANMYREGLIDPESFSYNRQQYFAACQAREVGAGIGYYAANTFGAKASDYVTLYLKGPNGEDPVIFRNSGSSGPGSGPSITTACKTPEIAIRWINEFYKPELAAQNIHGVLGRWLIPSTDPQYMYEFSEVPAGISQDEYRLNYSNALGLEFYTPKNLHPVSATAALKKASDDAKMPYYVKEYLPSWVFTRDEMDEIQPIKNDLDGFTISTLANWIVKGTVDAEWEQVQRQLNRMKLPRYMEIHQKVYDRMTAAQ